MNILITGANGQLGNEIFRIQMAGNSSNHYIFTDVGELDITNLTAIRKLISNEHVNIIVNCAAYTNVDKAEDDRDMANLINNRAVENLAIASKETGVTLIHVSTDYVFKGDSCIPCKETQETDPIGIYGKTKLNGELSIQATGCKHLIIRTSWLYSKFGNNFVKTMQRLTVERDTLNVVFDQIGTPTYAGDLASLIYKIIEDNMYYKQGIYHFSNEGVCSWYDFAIKICDLFGNECDIQPCHSDEFPSKVKRPNFSVLDKAKIKKTFDVKIPHWENSLKKCINELKKETNEL